MVNVTPEVRAVFIEETGLPEAEADLLLARAPEDLLIGGKVSAEVLMFYYMMDASNPESELGEEQKQRIYDRIMAALQEVANPEKNLND